MLDNVLIDVKGTCGNKGILLQEDLDKKCRYEEILRKIDMKRTFILKIRDSRKFWNTYEERELK